MKFNKLFLQLFTLAVLLISCNDNDDDNLFVGDGASFENGILISGEGSGAGTGSISFISNDFSVQTNQIFKTINNEELGTFLQSIAFDDENAYISVDNAATITVVDRYTFEEKGKIQSGLDHPRYMVAVDGIGYSTNWGTGTFGNNIDDDYIAVIDIENLTVLKTIPVSVGPERILEKNGKLYITHKGAYGTNNIISIIDIETEIISEITVSDDPDEMFFDETNNLWILSSGRAAWTGNESKGSIHKINTTSNTISKTFDLDITEHPDLMTYSDGKIYYFLNNLVYEMESTATELPTSSLLDSGYIYGMAINNNKLFTLNASFSKLSELSVYEISTKEKTNSFNISLGASKIYFN